MVSPKEPPGFLFDLHNERGEAGAWEALSRGCVSGGAYQRRRVPDAGGR